MSLEEIFMNENIIVNDKVSEQTEVKQSDAYCLSQLEIFNWGPFEGLHRIDFDPTGCALIGQTGSGKTTLVDAIMTLICALPKYNLASTGGHESDRDMMSYIRGVTGTGGDDETIHIARAGQTITGLSATFSVGGAASASGTASSSGTIINDRSVSLTALLWLDSSSTSHTDMKRLWIFDKGSYQGLADYLQQLQEFGIRGLKLQLKDQPGLWVSQNKKSYLAQCRRFFEVGENAFVLLNRAAGLKQLNSIDDLFRNLVLDDRSAFERAGEVTQEFDELKGIHAELEIAKEQQQSLLPIADLHKRQQKNQKKLKSFNDEKHLLPRWFAYHACQLWEKKANNKQIEIEQYQLKIEQQTQQRTQQQALVDEHYLSYQKMGGANLEDLKRQIEDREKQYSQLKQYVRDYEQICLALKLNADLSAVQLTENQMQARQLTEAINNNLQALEEVKDQQIQNTLNEQDHYRSLDKEIQLVKATPDSNIPPKYLQFQLKLAQELQISLSELPFLGQCVEVKDKNWQGAIERAIGSHRLRMVVNAQHMQLVLDWVNQRNNQLHVRLLNTADYQQRGRLLDDGFYHKLNFKTGKHLEVVKNFIISIDRHCVASVKQLKQLPFSMTREGMMSGKRGLFEKQDQKLITQGWMTGFDNQHRLAELQQDFALAKQKSEKLRQQLEKIKNEVKTLQYQLILLEKLQKVEFQELDCKGMQIILEQLEQRLKQLQDPDSDTGKAEQVWKKAKQILDTIQDGMNKLEVQYQISQKELSDAKIQILEAKQQFSESLTTQQIDFMQAVYAVPTEKDLDRLAMIERAAMQKLQDKVEKQSKQLAEVERRLGQRMVSAKQKDNGALTEVGTELEDVAAYLERLDLLNREALPAKLERFLHYLNQSSDQGVTHLLTSIDNEVSVIEERIEELNITLREVNFQPGKYLQLIPQKITHESLQSLQRAQRDLRSAAMQDDQGESHYKALIVLIEQLRSAVERKRTRPAQALLDPRYRLQFSVAVIERETKSVIETRTGSKGGSGGEKEIIASFILTASLSYALCPKGRTTPLFASVILDEAFSKSSQAVAARIIFALRQFGLHPLFVTPNKEMRLLRNHTASAVLVHMRGKQSRALSLSWQEIDAHIQRRKNHEITSTAE